MVFTSPGGKIPFNPYGLWCPMAVLICGIVKMTSEVQLFKSALGDYAKFTIDQETPTVMVTFTSLFPRTLRGKFLLLRAWDKFKLKMRSKLPWREYPFPLFAWAFEYSSKTVHIHAIFSNLVNARVLQKAWTDENRYDHGTIDIRPWDSIESALDYAFKDYSRLDKFIGHSVILRTQPLSTHKLDK